ncbi:MAG: ROK family protein, partial [Ilumatobacteraceae bacterium]
MSEQPDVRELALAIDIGGTKMAVGLVDRSGTLIDRESVRTDRDKRANDLFESLGALIVRQIQRGVERHGSRIVVVGIGSAGPIEPNCASVSPINIPAWQRFPLHEAVADVVRQAVGSPVPVFGDLDSKAFALAEGWLGAARGVSN